MAATLEAPVVVPAAPTTPPPGAVPTPGGVIHVTAPALDPGPQAPVKAGSAKDRMFKELRKKSNITEDVPAPPPPEDKSANLRTSPKAPEGETSDEARAPETAADKTEAKADPKKVSPWKLVDEWKKRAADAETKLVEATKSQPSEAQRKAQTEEFQRKEARLKELEDEIRYVNYSKSEEYKTKYEAPYDKAWSRAMSELGEISITDPASGEARAVTPADLLELVNLPLGKAQDLADEAFGKFSSAVMAHRKEIRGLHDAQAAALEEARKNGTVREQQMAERSRQWQQDLAKEVSETWSRFNEAAAKDEKYGKFFTPVEGDQEGNQRLEKGFDLVDKAFSENPFAPNLKPEERAAIVKRHAAVRNRAAAFGRLVLQVSEAEAKIAALTRELEQFKSSTPPAGASAPPQPHIEGSSARQSVFDALRKIAK